MNNEGGSGCDRFVKRLSATMRSHKSVHLVLADADHRADARNIGMGDALRGALERFVHGSFLSALSGRLCGLGFG